MESPSIEKLNSLRKEAYELLQKKEHRRSRELFEQLYDGQEPEIASCLGYIHSQPRSSEYDIEKALEYYRAAARNGHNYSQYALAGLLMERGDTDEAINWYTKASDAGNMDCSYVLFHIFKRHHNEEAARRFLDRAVSQGHAAAIQRRAIEYLTGKFGVFGIFRGIHMYLRNIPALVRYVKEREPPQ
jgi:TPR repeat protein